MLVGLLGRRVGGERLGVIAALLYAVYPVMIAVDGDLMSEVLYGPLIAGMLLTASRSSTAHRPARDRPRCAHRPGGAHPHRGAAVPAVPGAPDGLPGAAGLAGRGAARVAAIAGCLVVIAPWLIRNENVFGRFVLVSTNNQTVIAGANCARPTTGSTSGGWDITCIAPRTKTNEAAQAAIWQRDGLNYARHHLTRLPLVVRSASSACGTCGSRAARRAPSPRADLRWVEEAGVAVYSG